MATSPDARRIALNVSLQTRRDAHEADTGFGMRVLVWLKEFYCGLHGHDNLMQFGKDRMFASGMNPIMEGVFGGWRLVGINTMTSGIPINLSYAPAGTTDFKLFATIRVLTSEGRLSAWILSALPFVLLGLINLINPRFMSLLWTDPAGILAIWGGYPRKNQVCMLDCVINCHQEAL